jgi:hypothetical protein
MDHGRAPPKRLELGVSVCLPNPSQAHRRHPHPSHSRLCSPRNVLAARGTTCDAYYNHASVRRSPRHHIAIPGLHSPAGEAAGRRCKPVGIEGRSSGQDSRMAATAIMVMARRTASAFCLIKVPARIAWIQTECLCGCACRSRPSPACRPLADRYRYIYTQRVDQAGAFPLARRVAPVTPHQFVGAVQAAAEEEGIARSQPNRIEIFGGRKTSRKLKTGAQLSWKTKTRATTTGVAPVACPVVSSPHKSQQGSRRVSPSQETKKEKSVTNTAVVGRLIRIGH